MFAKLKPLAPYLKRYRRDLILGSAAVIFYNIGKVLLPKVIGSAVDDLRLGTTHTKIIHHVLLILGIAAISGVFLYANRWIIIGVSREIEFDLRNDLFANLERQPMSFYHTHRTGDIMARTTNDLNAVRMLLGPAILYSENTIFRTALALPFMFAISVKLTLLAFFPLPLASILIQYFGAQIHSRFERIQAMFSEISAKAQENFSGARLIRAFAQEEAEIKSFETANQEYIRRSLLLVRLMAMLWPTLEFVLGISFVITLLVGGHEVIKGHITPGNYMAFSVYIVDLTFPVIAVGWVINIFQRGTASVIRIDELLKERSPINDVDAITTLPSDLAGDIEFRNLSFKYATGPEVLHDINLRIPSGTSLAIVGPTGSGKSTLVSLIPRLHDAPTGQLFIDGNPIRNYPLDTLRCNIGFVPQETFLFSETIHENIAFGVESATGDQVLRAATAAHIANEILEFPAGFQTMVGERGLTLSGGQKQRTSIARAVIRNPRILILDDALASVDTYTEERILTELQQVMKGRTTLFISHRVSTARTADQIAVLVNGRIAEQGTHEELIARNGYYTSLYEKQRLEEEISVTA